MRWIWKAGRGSNWLGAVKMARCGFERIFEQAVANFLAQYRQHTCDRGPG